MDSLIPHQLLIFIMEYGSFALFGLLALGIIALPIPDETLMVLAGVLICKGDLHFLPTIFAAYGGAMCGITISYIFGRTCGLYLLHKFGRRIGITQNKLDYAHSWFEHYGKWTLTFGYFIPGIRHFTGISAGVSNLEYHHFALFAYCGAVAWASTFLAIGYFFGDYWVAIFEFIETNIQRTVFVTALLLVGYFLYKLKIKK